MSLNPGRMRHVVPARAFHACPADRDHAGLRNPDRRGKSLGAALASVSEKIIRHRALPAPVVRNLGSAASQEQEQGVLHDRRCTG